MDKDLIKLIAFYLPQYHPIPENDEWWGKGFTEWRNVVKAKPNFVGHYQPHLPSDLGFYDLRLPEIRDEQAVMAQKYGIYGFCYYYYWFNGKKLLDRPLSEVLSFKKPSMPFCICWANENWTRRWDGFDKEVLIGQEHSIESDKRFITDIIPILSDKRYIRVHGKPLLLVYRVDLLPNVLETIKVWKSVCRKAGLGDPYLVAVQSFSIEDPRKYGFDAAVEFPPHRFFETKSLNQCYKMVNNNFNGKIFDYQRVVDLAMERENFEYTVFRGVMPMWDNTARRQNNSYIFVNNYPENYQYWLNNMTKYTEKNNRDGEKIMFVNAWNEWAEGCYLEPDQKNGYDYLEATKRALDGHSGFKRKHVDITKFGLKERLKKYLNNS